MDWNEDGYLDIIVGDREGFVNYFRRLPAGNVFLTGEPRVTVGGLPIDMGYNSSPSVFDWNADDLPDLVVGRTEGIPAGLILFLNQGTPGEPLFVSTDTVMCSGEPIQEYYGYPDFHDMDGDSLSDLVLGSSSGKISFYLNEGEPGEPLFREFEYMVADGEEINFYSYVRPSVCDWNEDGWPDILAADYTGNIYLYLGVPQTGVEGGPQTGEGVMELRMGANPAVSSLGCQLLLEEALTVSGRIHSLDGRLAGEFNPGWLQAGPHTVEYDCSDLEPGVYVLVIESGTHSITRTFTLIK